MFFVGQRHGLVDNSCNEVQKLCKSLDAQNSGFVFASIPLFKRI